MELHQLRYFVAVAQRRSFSRAARELRVAQPSVSQQIQKLENELGTRLLDRTRRGVLLTTAGHALLPRARSALQQLEEARLEMEELSGLQRGQLSLGALPSVGTYLLPRALSGFHQLHPGIQLHLKQAGSRDLVEQLTDGALDLAILILPVESQPLKAVPLFKEELVLAVPPEHRLAGAQSVALRELADEPFILFQEGYELRESVLAACRKAGFKPRVGVDGGEMDSVPRLVQAGLGVALLPRLVAESGPGPCWVPVRSPHLSRQVGIVWHRDRYQSSASETFVQHVRSQMASQAADLAEQGVTTHQSA